MMFDKKTGIAFTIPVSVFWGLQLIVKQKYPRLLRTVHAIGLT